MPPFEFEEEQEPEQVPSFTQPQEQVVQYTPGITIQNSPEPTPEVQAARDAVRAEAIRNSFPHVLLAEYRFINLAEAEDFAEHWGAMDAYWNNHPITRTVTGITLVQEYDSSKPRYIFLNQGEILQSGDEVWTGSRWHAFTNGAGENLAIDLLVRRKVV